MIDSIPWNGKRITKPGLYSKIPLSAYHLPDICGRVEGGKTVSEPSISSSGLRKINPDVGSLAHFFAEWAGNPHRVKKPESRAFVFGRAVHHLWLGEPFFAKLFCVQPEQYAVEERGKQTGELKPWSNNALPCRRWHDEQRKLGRSVLTSKEVEAIKHMSETVGRHPLVKGFLGGDIERSFFWKDKETGVWLKWRPDAIPTSDLDFCDLKTTPSTLWPDLVRTLREYAYYQQAALGRVACREILKRDMTSYTFLFVEKKPPWWPRDVRIDEGDLDRGERMNRACLRNFATALRTGEWPGPGCGSEGNEKLRLSEDARIGIDKRLEMEGLADGRD